MSRQVERPPRRWRARAVGAVIGSALLLGVAAAATGADTPSSPTSDLGVVPFISGKAEPGGNVSCQALGLTPLGERVDAGNIGPDSFPGIDVTVTGGTYVAWTADPGITVSAVIVKGGDAANVYAYNPPPATGDSGLASPPNASGGPAGLSNLTFCGDMGGEVKISKWVKGLGPDEETWPSFEFTFAPIEGEGPAGESVASLTVKAGQKESIFLDPGDYLVTENGVGPESDYELLWSGCRDYRETSDASLTENDSPPVNPQRITVDEYGLVKCKFVNGKTPKLIVDKVVTGGEGDITKFDFTLTGEFPMPVLAEPAASEMPVLPTIDPVNFQLANGESTSLPLRAPECVPYLNGIEDVQAQGGYYDCFPAEYTLSELPVPEGYEFVSLVCERDDPWMEEVVRDVDTNLVALPNGDIEPVIDGPVATFGHIGYGTVVRCTYTNLKLPKLTVNKVLTNGSGDGLTTPFPFMITNQPEFTLTSGQSNGPRILPVGPYTVTEGTVPAGFTFTSASCTNTGNVPTGTPDGATRSVALNLAAGDDVTCTFINNQTPPPPPVTPPPPAVITQVLNPRLAINKVGPKRARPLQRFTYTIRVRNPGKAVARNVVIIDRLPSGLIYVKASRKATVRGRTITIRMGNLQPGRFRTVKVTVRAAASVRGRKVNLAVARATNVRPVRDTAATVFRPLVRRVIPAVTG